MGGLVDALAEFATKVAPDLTAKAKPLFSKVADYGFRDAYSALNKIGEPGEALSNLLKDQTIKGSAMEGGLQSKFMDAMKDVPQEIAVRLPKQPALAPQAAAARQGIFENVESKINSLGGFQVPNPNYVAGQGMEKSIPWQLSQNFHPFVVADRFLEAGQYRPELEKVLADSGKFNTPTGTLNQGLVEQTVNKIRGLQNGKSGLAFMHDGTIEPGLALKDIPGISRFLEQDPKVADLVWSKSAASYISKIEAFGPKYATVKSLISSIGTIGQDAKELATSAVEVHEHGWAHLDGRPFYEGQTDWEQAIKRFEALTKLGRMGIAEPSQNLNALVLTSVKSIAEGVKKIVSDYDDALKFTLDSGGLVNESIRDFKQLNHGFAHWSDVLFHYTGVDAIRKFDNILTANAVRSHVQELAAKLVDSPNDAEANLWLRKYYGVEPSVAIRQGGQLTDTQVLEAARRGIHSTMFPHDPMELPLVFSKSPVLRTAFLYKSFIYREANFLGPMIADSFKTGKYQNIAYMALLFPAVGELVRDTEMLAQGRSPNDRLNSGIVKGIENKALARYIDNFAGIGAIGIFTSSLGAVNRGNISQWLGGPAMGDVEDMGRVAKNLAGGNFGKAAGTIANRIPVIGSAINNLTKGN